MNLSDFSLGFLSASTALAALGFLAKTWIEKRIEFSVEHEYSKKLSDYENKSEIRLKAELVADLMAEWIRNEDSPDYYHRLNQLSLQAFLWLPPNLAQDLSDTLAHKTTSDDARTIIQKVRKHLLGDDDSLESNAVIIFRRRPMNSSDATKSVVGEASKNVTSDTHPET
ncbi:hypothetical protein [Burkholderia glumae]|uniref:hypothetical protein n=1 Tax=Burkholderia glumae TaxID=337 RepID=UPI002151CC77|nr:hypothetical protein [Burkholderia glumae]